MLFSKRVNSVYYYKAEGAASKMRNAWRAAMANLHRDNANEIEVWDSVRGLASACIATLGRIGWDIHISTAWRVWIDRNGIEIDLAEMPIHSLKKIL